MSVKAKAVITVEIKNPINDSDMVECLTESGDKIFLKKENLIILTDNLANKNDYENDRSGNFNVTC